MRVKIWPFLQTSLLTMRKEKNDDKSETITAVSKIYICITVEFQRIFKHHGVLDVTGY